LTWQDELGQLDAELASGRISADEYRMRRDQVLASAANVSQTPKPQATGKESSAEKTQMVSPVTPADPPVTPAPADSSNATEGDRTQAVQQGWARGDRGGNQGGDADRTQAVQQQGWTRGDPGGNQGDDADRTQIVPGVAPPSQGAVPSPPGGFPQQPGAQAMPPWQDEPLPPQWSGPDLPTGTPWAGSGFSTGADPWTRQGPEVFEESGGKTGKIVAIVVAVVLLVGIGIGAYLMWGRDSGGTTGEPNTSANQPTTTSETKPPDPMAIAELPGTAQPKEVKAWADVAALNYLTQSEVTAYEKAQPSKASILISKFDNGTIALVLVVQAGSVDAAKTAVDELVQQQVTNKATEESGWPQNVRVTSFESTFRAHYAHQDVIVRVEVRNSDKVTSGDDFKSVLESQLDVSSADG
jgi:hypothetical protein